MKFGDDMGTQLQLALGMLQKLDAMTPQLDDDLIDILERAAHEVGAVGWEIGPDIYDPQVSSLAFSAGLDRARLEAITRSIFMADGVVGWRVYAGLPPKDWEMFFEIETEGGDAFGVEGREWRYSFGPSDGSSLFLFAPSNLMISSDQLSDSAKLICVGELGERNCIEFFSDVVARRNSIPPMGKCMGGLAAEFARSSSKAAFSDILSRKKNGVVSRNP